MRKSAFNPIRSRCFAIASPGSRVVLVSRKSATMAKQKRRLPHSTAKSFSAARSLSTKLVPSVKAVAEEAAGEVAIAAVAVVDAAVEDVVATEVAAEATVAVMGATDS